MFILLNFKLPEVYSRLGVLKKHRNCIFNFEIKFR